MEEVKKELFEVVWIKDNRLHLDIMRVMAKDKEAAIHKSISDNYALWSEEVLIICRPFC